MHTPKHIKATTSSEIDSDQPILTFKEDRLSRDSLVARLTNLIISSTENNKPLTIAINAPWGVGKSSFLNLLENSIQQKIRKKVDIIKFNPWHYNSTDDLVQTMISELSFVIGKSTPKIMQKAGQLLAQLANSQISTSLWLGVPFTLLAGNIEARRSLENLRNELDGYFRDHPKRIIVLIDDVDRLERDALRMLFKMLRLIIDFPNVIYILAYDRNVVEELLQDETNVKNKRDSVANHYLEKIVQLSVDLPQPEESVKRDILISQMMNLLETTGARPLDERRWANIMHSGFLKHFRTIRNIKRYVNGLAITLPILAKEVDSGDFFTIELIRLFHPIIYRELADAKDILTMMDDPDEGKQIIQFTENLCKTSSNTMENNLKELLQVLFPRIQKAYDGIHDSSVDASWRRDGRVCAAENFDKFFLLAVPQGEIPNVRIRSIIDGLSDEQLTIKVFRTAIPRGSAFKILDRIEDYIDKIPQEHLQVLVRVLFELGDCIQYSARNESSLANGGVIPILILRIMRRLPNHIQEGLLTEGINNGKSLWTVMNAVELYIPASQSSSHSDSLKLNNKEKIKSMAVERLQRQVVDKSLWTVKGSTDALPFILHCWLAWGDENEVKLCINEWIQNDDNFLVFLRSFISKSRLYPSDGVFPRIRTFISLEWLKIFVDSEVIQNRLNKLANTKGNRTNEAKSLLDLIHNSPKTLRKTRASLDLS